MPKKIIMIAKNALFDELVKGHGNSLNTPLVARQQVAE